MSQSGTSAKKHVTEATKLALKMTLPPVFLLVVIVRLLVIDVISMSVWAAFTLVWMVKVALDFSKKGLTTA